MAGGPLRPLLVASHRIGSDAITAIVDGLPSLGGFGQLTAIEVFEEVGDPRCGPALIGLLDSDNPTVREWAAMALANLEIDGAIEPLRRAHRACLRRTTPPDWTEPSGIRWALTELGDCSPVVPPLTARLRATAADDAPGWPSAHFTEIINDLADHAQVILYSQFWQVDAGRTYGISDTGLDWQLDWTAPVLGAPGRRGSHVVPAGSLRGPRWRHHLRRPHLDRPYRPTPREVTAAAPVSQSTAGLPGSGSAQRFGGLHQKNSSLFEKSREIIPEQRIG
ncbi:hypothetical protein GCM10010207_04310 [Streptomyces atratus]|nr:hypothetical protein GCM10010207_04310 [Streptomyces atratus]